MSLPLRSALSVLAGLSAVASATGSLPTDASPLAAPIPADTQPQAPLAPVSPFTWGVDSYVGLSNIAGDRRFYDGMWAGVGTAYPSVSYLSWRRGDQSAKVAVGTGAMYTGASARADQPVEAWWSVPAGKVSLTLGKFWVPFAEQEWEYETKPGVMAEWSNDLYDVTGSVQFNRHTNALNSYLHLGRAIGGEASVGVSLCAGRGCSYDSPHNLGWGLDGDLSSGNWRVCGEYVELLTSGSERFTFGYGKVQYDGLGRWGPFAAIYTFSDAADELGAGQSTVLGLNYALAHGLTVESGCAFASDKRLWWLQLHVATER